MIFGFSNPRYAPIAVDFGADALKLLQVVPTDPPQMVAAASVAVPAATRGNPGLRNAFLADALKALLRTGIFKGRRAILSLPAYQTLVHNLQITPGDEGETAIQIEQHLRQRLNIEPTRMVIRHFSVGPVMRDGANKEEIICLAASRDVVMAHLDIAQRARLDVVGMHSEPVAILKAFGHLFRRQDDAERTVGFIDIGAATTKVVIAQGGHMVFAKTIHAAGEHLTRQRAQAQGVEFAEARQMRIEEAAAGRAAHQVREAEAADAAVAAVAAAPRRTGGLAVLESQLAAQSASEAGQEERSSTAGADGNHSRRCGAAARAAEGANETIDCLIDELQLCTRYYQSMFPQRPLEKLVFLGGEAHQVSLCQKVARALRIGAQLGDPLARLARASAAKDAIKIDMRQPQPGWAVPLGLCLSEPNL